MKIKNIASICKKSKHFIIYQKLTNDGEITQQYISDGFAVYPLEDLPILDEKSVLTILDIPKDKHCEYSVSVSRISQVYLNFDDAESGEEQIDYSDIFIGYGGKMMRAFFSQQGAMFVSTKYFSPLNSDFDSLTFYKRATAHGTTYIVVKEGLFAKAFLLPIKTEPLFNRQLNELAQENLKFQKKASEST